MSMPPANALAHSDSAWRCVSGTRRVLLEMKMVCCLMLGSAAMQVPSKAKAATDDDKKFLAMAAQSDQNEIALSQAASEKATNPAPQRWQVGAWR